MPSLNTNTMLTPGQTDQSVHLFDQILGSGWWSWLWSSGGAGGSSSALGDVVRMLNISVLSALAIMLIYMAAIGVVGTSHDGVPLGKRYHSSWVPIRAGLSVTFMTPLPWTGGFSLLQAAALFLVFSGIGLASTTWKTTVHYLADHGGRIAAVQTTPADQRFVANTLKSLVAQRYLVAAQKMKVKRRWSWVWIPDQQPQGLAGTAAKKILGGTGSGVMRLRVPAPSGAGLDREDLGFIEIRCASEGSASCSAKRSATNLFISDMMTAAIKIVSKRLGSGHTYTPVTPADILQPMNRYFEHLDANNSVLRSRMNSERTSAIKSLAKSSADKGWLAAGGWYWSIARFQEQYQRTATDAPTATGPDLERVANTAAIDSGEAKALIAHVDDILRSVGIQNNGQQSAVQAALSSHKQHTSTSTWDRIANKLSAQITPLMRQGIAGLTGGDPMLKLEALGSGLVTAAMELFGAITTGSVLSFIPGAGGVISKISDLVMPIFFMLLIAGLVLSLYLPAIPMIIFWSGIVSWVILVLEVLIAAPLWAFSHAMTDGEGFSGDHARAGYVLMIRAALQPTLMIVGLLLAMIAFTPLAHVLGGYVSTFADSLTGGSVGIFTAIFLLGLLILLIIGAAHRVFGLITLLPGSIFRFLGSALAGSAGGDPAGGDARDTSRTLIAGVRSAPNHAARALKGAGRGRISDASMT